MNKGYSLRPGLKSLHNWKYFLPILLACKIEICPEMHAVTKSAKISSKSSSARLISVWRIWPKFVKIVIRQADSVWLIWPNSSKIVTFDNLISLLRVWLKFAKIVKSVNIHSVWQNFVKFAIFITSSDMSRNASSNKNGQHSSKSKMVKSMKLHSVWQNFVKSAIFVTACISGHKFKIGLHPYYICLTGVVTDFFGYYILPH